MPDIADLLRERSLTGLDRLAGTDPQAYEDALVERVRGDITRQIDEDANRRGMLTSTDRDRRIADALSKARLDAAVQSQQAQLAALAAASGASANEMQLRQQGQQFQQSHGLAKKQLGQQKDVANLNAMVVGGGGLINAGLKTFAPEVRKGLDAAGRGISKLFSRGSGGPVASPAGSVMDAADVGTTMPPTGLGALTGAGGGYSVPSYDFGGGVDYAAPSSSYDWGGGDGGSNLDLSGLASLFRRFNSDNADWNF